MIENTTVSCSSLGYINKKLTPGTYRSILIPPKGTDRNKAAAISDLLKKMGWTDDLCTGDCSNKTTHECKCTGLESKIDDDCELTLEREKDGTTYYKAVITAPGSVDLKCPGLAGDQENLCKCLARIL